MTSSVPSFALHVVPPLAPIVVTVLVLVRVPSPQDWEQAVLVHSPHWQSTEIWNN